MPQIGLRNKFQLTTRSSFTKVNCEVGISVEGNELPNTAVLGDALDAAIELFQQKITESYKVVPERPSDTPQVAPTF